MLIRKHSWAISPFSEVQIFSPPKWFGLVSGLESWDPRMTGAMAMDGYGIVIVITVFGESANITKQHPWPWVIQLNSSNKCFNRNLHKQIKQLPKKNTSNKQANTQPFIFFAPRWSERGMDHCLWRYELLLWLWGLWYWLGSVTRLPAGWLMYFFCIGPIGYSLEGFLYASL